MSGIDEMPESVRAKQDEKTTDNSHERFRRRTVGYSRVSDYAYSCERYYHFRLDDDELWENVGD